MLLFPLSYLSVDRGGSRRGLVQQSTCHQDIEDRHGYQGHDCSGTGPQDVVYPIERPEVGIERRGVDDVAFARRGHGARVFEDAVLHEQRKIQCEGEEEAADVSEERSADPDVTPSSERMAHSEVALHGDSHYEPSAGEEEQVKQASPV